MVGIAQSPEITEMAVGEGITISQRASRYRLFIHCHSNSEEKKRSDNSQLKIYARETSH